MKMYIDFSALSTKSPLIFRHRTTDLKRSSQLYTEVTNQQDAKLMCGEGGSHFPFLFIDECNTMLPPEDFLAMFQIVLTTTKVCFIIPTYNVAFTQMTLKYSVYPLR